MLDQKRMLKTMKEDIVRGSIVYDQERKAYVVKGNISALTAMAACLTAAVESVEGYEDEEWEYDCEKIRAGIVMQIVGLL
jgi:hypothetical protein